MRVNTNRWNRLRYTAYAPFYDLIARRLGRGRRRAIELLNVREGERVRRRVPGGDRANYFLIVFARYSRTRSRVESLLQRSRTVGSSSLA